MDLLPAGISVVSDVEFRLRFESLSHPLLQLLASGPDVRHGGGLFLLNIDDTSFISTLGWFRALLESV